MLLGSPGDEELILDGLQAALGDATPVLGGSSGDNAVTGAWRQMAKAGTSNFNVGAPTTSGGGITIAIAWASCEVATVLTSGFRQTEHRGVVTKVDAADHGRTILEIDGEPTKAVYERWSEGKIAADVPFDENGVATVLAPSSFRPLGEPTGDGHVRVMHPAFLNKHSGALTTFADAREGMQVVMLDAAPETMAKKISQSAKSLVADAMDASAAAGGSSAKFETKDVVGALSIFCGGLVMAIDDKMPMAAEQLAEVLGHNNTMGVCCFGEQGMDHCRRATHGNLMFGCLLFSNKRRETDKAQATLTELGDDAGTAKKPAPTPTRAKASAVHVNEVDAMYAEIEKIQVP